MESERAMIRVQGQVATREASRWLQHLCFHFSRKIPVQYDAQQGRAEFPWGRCELRAAEQALHFDCSAPSAAQLQRVQQAIDSHLALFSRRRPLAAQWQALPAQTT